MSLFIYILPSTHKFLSHRSILTCVSFNLLYHDTYKHEGVSNASYMVFSTHVNVSMFEVKIPLKQNMRMKFNEVD